MLDAFLQWLIRNWDIIITVFMWSMTFLMGFIFIAKIYKIVKLDFEASDSVGLIFATLWLLAVVFFGFNHVTQYLQSFL